MKRLEYVGDGFIEIEVLSLDGELRVTLIDGQEYTDQRSILEARKKLWKTLEEPLE